MVEFQPLIFILSFLSDYLAIILMRRLFISISQSISTAKLALTMMTLIVFAGLITVFLPFCVGRVNNHFPTRIGIFAEWLAVEFLVLNITTAILSLVPAIMLVAVSFTG